MVMVILFCGCGYGTSQTRVVSGPTGSRVTYNSRCFGAGCNEGAYGERGMWLGGRSPYPYSAAEGRLGLIEAYRARNHWVRSDSPEVRGGQASTSARDTRIDALVPYVRHMANAMCNNGILSGEDCAPPERQEATSSQGEGR